MQITPRTLLAAPAALLLIACGATEPNAMHPVNLSAAIAGGAPAGGGSSTNLIVGDQSGSVSISSAQMVLSRIELANNQSCTGGSSSINASNQDDDEPSDSSDIEDEEPSDSSDVDNGDGESSDSSDVDNGDGESSDSSDVDNDDGEASDSSDVDDDDGESSDSSDVDNDSPSASGCVPLQTGQVLVNLPLDGATKGIAGGLVPAGTYTRLRANLQTVKVVGVYTDANGTARQFTLTRRLNVVSAIRLDAPVTVDAAMINLILDVGVRSWFTDRTGAVFDPTSAANQSVVERNILRSLRARS